MVKVRKNLKLYEYVNVIITLQYHAHNYTSYNIIQLSYSLLSLSIYVANKNSFVLALKLLSQLQTLRTAQYSVSLFILIIIYFLRLFC